MIRHSLSYVCLLLAAVVSATSTLASDTNEVKPTAASIADARMLADIGDMDAENYLGTLSSTGEGKPHLPKDDAAAINWWRQAADQGQADAALHLAIAYLYSFGGVHEDVPEALKWLRKSAENGNPHAQFMYGSFYIDGKYIPKDIREALKWWHKAADQGLSQAEAAIGAQYANGEGVEQDDREALKWTQKGAEHGNRMAQFNLGQMYHQGKGVPKNQTIALTWWRKAADRGDVSAQVRLADAYAKGDGLPQDTLQAAMWYEIAGQFSTDYMDKRAFARQARNQLEKSMSTEQIGMARTMADEKFMPIFLASHGHIVTDSNWSSFPR